MPYYPGGDDDEIYYEEALIAEKFVSDYTGLNFSEIKKINIIEFSFYLRNAFIHKLNATPDGREYLEKCWYFKQTEADRSGLRKLNKSLRNG